MVQIKAHSRAPEVDSEIEPPSVSVPARSKCSELPVEKQVHTPFHWVDLSPEHREPDRLARPPYFTPNFFCVWTRQREST